MPLASYLAYEHVAGAGGGISSEVDIGASEAAERHTAPAPVIVTVTLIGM